ncbi:SpoIID/LytB domain protein [Stanieria cyanosphaera PCC 7437]|uniref:SpoIID/LytB domain protein n=1 Tax=Stanieria cyanosphaera (strain ATCC 29371 / PCC 7437) TaxID=111780 RepID=K9XP69_STAC7|nr:SpoIID/LytB domain-containing protein [Stanieria cyanosphaera]AFZ33884.1 SpoIID/LytB domain protein [Stanieria cyanosphaera PCC 7437]
MSRQNYSTLIKCLLKQSILNQKHHWWLSAVIWICLIFPSQALELRVAIKKNVADLKVGSSTSAIVKDGAGKPIGELNPMAALAAQPQGNGIGLDRLNAGEIIIEPSQKDGLVWIGDRWYRGRTHLVRQGDTLTAINYVDLEDYLYSVVGAEAVATWPLEALKAQAVAARSYALYKSSTERSSLYDLDTTIGTQVYKGLDTEYTTTHQAVNGTAGQVMTYNGKVILAAFHSSSGGHTENVEDVWTSPLPYLRAVVDYDQQSPVFQWDKVVSAQQMNNLIAGVGTIKTMVPEETTPHGRVVNMKVVGDRGTTVVTGAELRKVLDLRSTLFRVTGDGANFRIYGRGFGHGLGLSQWGAYYLAKQGVKYAQILSHYYQQANLSQINR